MTVCGVDGMPESDSLRAKGTSSIVLNYGRDVPDKRHLSLGIGYALRYFIIRSRNDPLSVAVQGVVSANIPYGLELEATASVGTPYARVFGGVAFADKNESHWDDRVIRVRNSGIQPWMLLVLGGSIEFSHVILSIGWRRQVDDFSYQTVNSSPPWHSPDWTGRSRQHVHLLLGVLL